MMWCRKTSCWRVAGGIWQETMCGSKTHAVKVHESWEQTYSRMDNAYSVCFRFSVLYFMNFQITLTLGDVGIFISGHKSSILSSMFSIVFWKPHKNDTGPDSDVSTRMACLGLDQRPGLWLDRHPTWGIRSPWWAEVPGLYQTWVSERAELRLESWKAKWTKPVII